MAKPEADPAGAQILRRAFIAQGVLGAIATVVAWASHGGFAAQSVALGAIFAAAHLFTVAKSVRSAYGDGVSPAARFFVILRSLRFLTVLAAAGLVLIAGFAGPVGFLFGYALLVPAIVLGAIVRSTDEP